MPSDATPTPKTAKNVLGGALESCSTDPMTGYFRDGCCNTDENDFGAHTVCAVVTDSFLAFTETQGNNLATPRPEFGFPGLKSGDRWCVCAARWVEALSVGAAPRVVLAATHERTLQYVSLEDLKNHAAD